MSFPSDLLDPRDASPTGRLRLRSWLRLQAAYRLHPEEVAAVLRGSRPGPGRDAADPAALLASGARRPDCTEPLLARWAKRLAECAAIGLPLGAADYPDGLATLVDAPPLLWVQGEVSALAGPAVAIVGARAPTAYGLGMARRLAGGLAERGFVVVSGLARGIDGAAHHAALDAGGRTVAVQACGPDLVYPGQHRRLAARIRGNGACVSEHPPGTPPLPYHFPLRNRLISGLSRLVIVVEARPGSGSLITARHALDQGRDVMAVPGPADAPTSLGPNRLLRDGARPALGVGDVLEELGEAAPAAPSAGATPTSAADGRMESRPPLGSAEERAVWEALRFAPRSRDELVRALGRPPEALAMAILQLELAGRIEQDRDGRLRLRNVSA